MPADIDVSNAINGTFPDGSPRPWAWVHVRARTILGYVTNNGNPRKPFFRGNTPATPSALDHIIGTAEQVATRYVASDGNVWDLHDFLRVSVEKLIAETDPAKLKAYRASAATFRNWPAGYASKPDFE